MFKLKMTSGVSGVIVGGVSGRVYGRGDGGSWVVRRRRVGRAVSLMSELDREKV